MKMVEAIIQPIKLDDVVERLRMIGIQGMTISEVRGFGRTGGHTEIYRGSAYKVDFVPKIRLQVVVEDKFVEQVCSAIVLKAATGKVGDGKVFVRPVDDVVRIRTGETGEDAL